MQALPPILSAGLLLCASMIGLAWLSYGFPYGVDIQTAPLAPYVLLALFAGGVWAWLGSYLPRLSRTATSLWVVIGLGLVMRAAMFFSIPVLEDDSYRYLWDGAVTANGLDPYAYAPAEVASDSVLAVDVPQQRGHELEQLRELAEANPETHSRINFPYVSTIYPPLAQAAFAAAYWIDPFGLTGWRAVLLLSDLATLFLLIRVLRAFKRPAIWVSLYWWNPVVLLQGYGAAHMDLLLLPFLLLALLMAKSQRIGLASLALAGGAAVKIWPILLFPVLLRPALNRPAKVVVYSGVFGIAVTFLLFPQMLHALAPEAGLNAYASDWRTHAFAFAILEDLVFAAMEAPGQMARLTVAAMMIALTGYLALRYGDDVDRLPALWAAIIAATIFLSPTGYPWYLIWLAPLLPFLPKFGLLALFALAPLYWLRFPLGDQALIYQWGIVPIAFGVPLALIAASYLKRRPHDAFSHHHPRFE
ncbi:MAG: hypothetical protein AAFZ74_18625 [Pseudomonadota bacterium]